jgi:hypothetical protein
VATALPMNLCRLRTRGATVPRFSRPLTSASVRSNMLSTMPS